MSYKPASPTAKPLSIKVAPELGSNMFSLRWGSHDIIYTDPALLKKCGFTGCFVLFPTPNRVKNFTYTWDHRNILLKKRGKTVELHGLVIDEQWKFRTPRVQKNSITLETSISITKSSPLYDAFPFLCRLTLEYILYSNKVTVRYTVKNVSREKLPFGFALHPYFTRLSGDDKTRISVPTKYWMESPKDTLLPTGNLIDVSGKPYDIRKPTPLSKLHLDHVYTGFRPNSSAVIDYQTLKMKINLITSKDFTHAVVYTGEPHAVCIENQTCSTDAHNLWSAGLHKESHLLTIAPGASHTGHITYEVKSY